MPTAFQTQPIPWSELPTECFWYLFLMASVHIVVCAVDSAISAFMPSKHPGGKLRRIARLGFFNLLLLIVATMFNGLWSCLIWGRLYDSTDYTFDFVPFWPITQAVIDSPWGNDHGHLLGVSLFQLQLVWFLFAAGTWAVTIFLYGLLRRLDRQ